MNEHNRNTERIAQVTQGHINVLSCGGEEPTLTLADIFHIFSKSKNEEFRAQVQSCSNTCNNGEDLDFE